MKTKFWKKKLSNINTKEIGNDCIIHSHCWIGEKVKIGNRVKIQAFVFIPNGIEIEDDCFVGPGVIFTNDKYPPSGGQYWGKILVKKGASIGAGAVILPDVIIGENSLIGAGSIVTKTIPANEIWFGNPAKFSKKIQER